MRYGLFLGTFRVVGRHPIFLMDFQDCFVKRFEVYNFTFPMSTIVYIDANVWLDYYWNRKGRYLDLGDVAHRILQRTITCEFTVLVSDILLAELEKYVSDVKGLINPLEEKCVFIKAEQSDYRLARASQLHYPDSLHVILAEKHSANFFVTNDADIISDSVYVVKSSVL